MSFSRTPWLLAITLVLGCRTTAPTPPKGLSFDPSTNVHVHEASGFSFPPRLARFEKVNGSRAYDDAGRDVSVPYSLRRRISDVIVSTDAVATIYVYPAPRDGSIPLNAGEGPGRTPTSVIDEQYNEVKQAIIAQWGARVVLEGEVPGGQSALDRSGKRGVFEYSVKGDPVLGSVYVFAHHGWFVKYRFTYPSKFREGVEPELDAFMREFRWP